MQLVFTDEQELLRTTFRDFLNRWSPESEVHRLVDSGNMIDDALWERLSNELGLQAIAIPEASGGTGGNVTDLVVVFEELGAALACIPYLSTAALAASALVRCGDDPAAHDLLEQIAEQGLRATLVTEQNGDQLHASRAGETWTLSGNCGFVIDGATADVTLIPVETDLGPTLFAVEGTAVGLSRRPLETIDLTRAQARLELDGVDATVVGVAGSAAEYVDYATRIATIAVAAEQVGGAQRLLDMTVEYAKIREQFGRPIGSFQAIKHRCVDMLVEIEAAKAAVQAAARSVDEGRADVDIAISVAKAYCSETFVNMATAAIQIHGGIGFTWEHSAHLYYRRARANAALLGDPSYHRARLARLLA